MTVELDIGETFGIEKFKGKIGSYPGLKGPEVPDVNPDFVFFLESFRDLNGFVTSRLSKGLYIFGNAGTGKSDLVRNYCALTGYPLFEVNANTDTQMSDLWGEHTLVDGSIKWIPGPLHRAMEEGGIFCIHEISLMRPNIIGALNIVLDSTNRIVAPNIDRTVIDVHPNFRFIVTDNTNGTGDERGVFLGRRPLSLDFLDRFMFIELDYLPEELEAEIIRRNNPIIPEEIIRQMVKFANETRKQFNSENPTISNIITTRTLILWSKIYTFAL